MEFTRKKSDIKYYYNSDDIQMFRAFFAEITNVTIDYKEKKNWFAREEGFETDEDYRYARQSYINSMVYCIFCYWYESRFMGRPKCKLLERSYFEAFKDQTDQEFHKMIWNATVDPLKERSYSVPAAWKISTLEEYQKLLPDFHKFLKTEKKMIDKKDIPRKKLHEKNCTIISSIKLWFEESMEYLREKNKFENFNFFGNNVSADKIIH